ncbi:MAG: M56 family metallopeptidase [Chitinophagaceae bacterium]
MNTFSFCEIFTQELFTVVSWTLVHSLWQGILLAFLAAIVIARTKTSTADTRYNLLMALFISQILFSIVTFYLSYQFTTVSNGMVGTGVYSSFLQSVVSRTDGGVFNDSLFPVLELSSFLSIHSRSIAEIWLIIILVLFMRMGTGLVYIQKLKQDKGLQVDSFWIKKLGVFKSKMGIKKLVNIRESRLIKVPLVVGFFKPLILLPVGLLNNIPLNQVEAIICHELAHIRRNDYLVNIFQGVVEKLYFFNPSILWISSLLHEEREHCCDDAVVRYAVDKRTLAEALFAFHNHGFLNIKLAPAFPGRRNKLFVRIKRIVSSSNSTLSPTIQYILISCIIIAGFILVAFKTTQHQVSPKSVLAIYGGNKKATTSNGLDTLPGNVELQKKLEEIDRKYEILQQQANPDLAEMKARLQTLQTSHAGKKGKSLDSLIMERDALISGIDEKEMNLKIARNREVKALMGIAPSLSNGTMSEPMNIGDKSGVAPHKYSDSGIVKRNGTDQNKEFSVSQSSKNGFDLMGNRPVKAELQTYDFFDDFIKSLLEDHIITTATGLSFFLSKDKFIVNDKIQPSNIHASFKKKFMKPGNTAIVYRFHNNMVGWVDDEEAGKTKKQ